MSSAKTKGIPLNFSGWKVFIPIAIGLFIAGLMLWNTLQKSTFAPVDPGTGTHSWVDANGNGRVDLKNPEEFVADPNGTHIEETISSLFYQTEWNMHLVIWLLIAIVFMGGRDFFYMVRIRVLTHNQLSWKRSFYVIMIWEFASALSPGIVGGTAVAMFILKREGIALGRSTAIIIITAFLDNLFYIVMIPLVFLFIHSHTLFPSQNAFMQSTEYAFWIGFGIIVFVCSLLFVGIFIYPKVIGKLLRGLFSLPFLKKWKEGATNMGKDIETAGKVFRTEKSGFWWRAIGSTFGSWISRYLVINAILDAFLNLQWADHLMILGKQLVLWLFLLISPTPGASGVAEFAFSELLRDYSASAILLIFMAIIWRIISYFPYLFIGSVLLPRWLRQKL